MGLVVETLAQRPVLESMLWQLSDTWPEFMTKDPISDLYYATVERDHPEYALVGYEAENPEVAVARAFAVPFAFGGDTGRDRLPDDGWDAVIRWAWLDRAKGLPATHVSALEIAVRPDRRGEGWSAVMLAPMRDTVRRLGFADLFALTIAGSLAEWRGWTGLPFDTTGDVEVPDALVPVHCSLEHDHAVYVEPGVWVHHRV